MRRSLHMTALGVTAAVAMTVAAPLTAHASDYSRQQNKNLWRNLAIGGAVLGGYGLLEHNNTMAAIGAAAGGYSAYRYEQDRHSQSVDNSRDHYFYHRNYGSGNYYGGNYGRNYQSYRGQRFQHEPHGNAYGWHRNHDR